MPNHKASKLVDHLLNEGEEYATLRKLCNNIWDGDLPFEEFIEGVSTSKLMGVDVMVMENASIFKDGVPFPEDSPAYKALLDTNPSARVLQKMINNWE